MPAYRSGKSLAEEFTKASQEYFDLLGTSNITLTKRVITVNSKGRRATEVVSTSTIQGDVQKSYALIKDFIKEGVARKGDGMFFTQGTTDIELDNNTEYEITYKGATWVLVSKVEEEQLDDEYPYQGWIIRLKPKR